MRLTARGWTTLGGGLVGIGGGRILGLRELYLLGATALALTLLSALLVRMSRVRLRVRREVRPRRVPVGGTCRVELTLRNTGLRRSPMLEVRDVVDDRVHAHLSLAPLGVGAEATMRYQLPVDRRGVTRIGPLDVEVSDPFGFAVSSMTTGSTVDVIVLPRIHPLRPIPPVPGDEPESGTHRLRSLANAHEEFSTLREYQEGDDVRAVHWPSTARLGRPIVRQFDEPWSRRTTVVLDVTALHHDHDSFERAVSAAASVLSLCAAQDEPVRLVGSDGTDSGFITADQHLDATLDLLAALQPQTTSSLTNVLRALVTRPGGGTLVTVTSALDDAEAAAVASLGGRFAAHLAISCASGVATPLPRSSTSVGVAFHDEQALSSAWNDALDELRRLAATSPGRSR